MLFFFQVAFFFSFSFSSNIGSNSIIGSCVYPGLCNTHKSLGRMCIWMLSISGNWVACVSGFVQHARTIGSHVHPGSNTHLQHLLGGANAFFFQQKPIFSSFFSQRHQGFARTNVFVKLAYNRVFFCLSFLS